MYKINKFRVINMSCVLGLFGVFTGLLFGIITAGLSFVIPYLETFKLWQILVGFPVGYGILYFILGLIFIPLLNLSLKIVRGLHLELGVVDMSKKPKAPEVKKPNEKSTKPLRTLTTNQESVSQITTVKPLPTPSTPIKSAI